VFITITSHDPGDVPAGRVKVHVRFVESSTITFEAKRSGFPVLEILTDAPLIKFVPVRFLILTALLLFPEFGVIRITVGAGPAGMTVKPLARIPGALPGFVTVTFH
jgi:hypothetical protein